MYLKILGVLTSVLLLSSCANMNESQCINADWRTIGFEDGSYGKNPAQISQHRKECSEYTVTPDLAAYRDGHFDGSKNFCTISNGFAQGNQGQDYNRNCPEQFETAFLVGFTDGQTLYGLKRILNKNSTELEDVYEDIDWFEHAIAEKSELMIADGLNREQRLAIRNDIAQYQQQQVELISILPQLKHDFESSLDAYDQAKEEFSNYRLTD